MMNLSNSHFHTDYAMKWDKKKKNQFGYEILPNVHFNKKKQTVKIRNGYQTEIIESH